MCNLQLQYGKNVSRIRHTSYGWFRAMDGSGCRVEGAECIAGAVPITPRAGVWRRSSLSLSLGAEGGDPRWFDSTWSSWYATFSVCALREPGAGRDQRGLCAIAARGPEAYASRTTHRDDLRESYGEGYSPKGTPRLQTSRRKCSPDLPGTKEV